MLYVINFKCYEQGTGKNALRLAKILEEVSKEKNVNIILSVQAGDISEIVKEVKLEVFSQHIDAISYGAYTGHILPESVKGLGATGTLLNHSEKRIQFEKLEEHIKRAKEVNLKTIVCCENEEEVKKIANFSVLPDYIAIEPKELIGGNISVSKAKPELIENCVKKARDIPLLCGAGIKTKEDVRIAKELGAKGVLVASGIVKAENPKEAMEELIVEE